MPEGTAGDTRAPYKRLAAERAVELVRSGMIVGLGTGTTARFAIRRIGELLAAGTLTDLVGVSTSAASTAEAERLGIPLVSDDWASEIDLVIDGADEVDPRLDLIKGGGGALLREKIVAQTSRRRVIVVDDSKLSPLLGSRSSLPVEVARFGWRAQQHYLESLGARVAPRAAPGGLFVTEAGNLILDCAFGPLAEPGRLAGELAARAGIVEHGLFLGIATDLVVAGPGGIEHRTRQ
jgi:ribose 5-phosphate isomerase A